MSIPILSPLGSANNSSIVKNSNVQGVTQAVAGSDYAAVWAFACIQGTQDFSGVNGTASANNLNRWDITVDKTCTLPTGSDGAVVSVMNKPSSTANLTLDAGVGGTVAGRTRYLILLPGNSITLYCVGGVDWVSIAENLDTTWKSVTAGSPTGSTTNPTFGTTTSSQYWRRVGDTMEVRWQFKTTTAGTAGAGMYKIPIPTGTMDTAKMPPASTATARPFSGNTIGVAHHSDASNELVGTVALWDSTNVSVRWVYDFTNSGWGSGFLPFSNPLIDVGLDYRVPMVNW